MLRDAMGESDTEQEPIDLEVCHRCLVRLPTSAGGTDLPRRIREALAARGLTGRTRVVPSSCLGYCPQGLVSVLVIPDPGGKGTHARFIDPERDGEDLAEHVSTGVTRPASRP